MRFFYNPKILRLNLFSFIVSITINQVRCLKIILDQLTHPPPVFRKPAPCDLQMALFCFPLIPPQFEVCAKNDPAGDSPGELFSASFAASPVQFPPEFSVSYRRRPIGFRELKSRFGDVMRCFRHVNRVFRNQRSSESWGSFWNFPSKFA